VSDCIDPNLVARIHELWPLVYQKAKITNGSIFLSFAKGIIVEKNEFKVNWVCYASQAQGMGGKGKRAQKIHY
jgi:hypothetical protein